MISPKASIRLVCPLLILMISGAQAQNPPFLEPAVPSDVFGPTDGVELEETESFAPIAGQERFAKQRVPTQPHGQRLKVVAIGAVDPESLFPVDFVVLRCLESDGEEWELRVSAGGMARLNGPKGSSRLPMVDLPDLAEAIDSLDDGQLGEADDFVTTNGDSSVGCQVSISKGEGIHIGASIGSLDSPPRWLQETLEILREIRVQLERSLFKKFPKGYIPSVGDILEKDDGRRYEVSGFTSDGTGIVIDSLEEPLRTILSVGDLPRAFVGVRTQSSPRRIRLGD